MTGLTVFMGIPASGKSTIARQRALDSGDVLLSTDAIRENRGINRGEFLRARDMRAHECLGSGQGVIIDACSMSSIHRRRWLDMAGVHGVSTTLVVVHCAIGIALERNRKRDHQVPRSVIMQYARHMNASMIHIKNEAWNAIEHSGYVPIEYRMPIECNDW